MKIAYITCGAADMYCGSCLRDNTLAAALIVAGHDCLLIPTYTPIRTDENDVSLDRVFFGGINIYLEQKTRLFRRMPALLDRLLSRPALLRWVSRFAVKTRPEDLGGLTVSMLKGMDGYQRREVTKLVRWLADEIRPEVVCLTTALISGLVPELKRSLNVPVLCSLQGEDIFLDWLPPDFKQEALALVQDNCRHFDGFITTSRYYADAMADYLRIPREKMHVVYPGINLNGYSGLGDGEMGRRGDGETRRRGDAETERHTTHHSPLTTHHSPTDHSPALTIGYLARICPEKGLHILVDAVHQLRRTSKLPHCRLRVAGYLSERDRPYLEEIRKKVNEHGWGDDFAYVGEVDHIGKIRFLEGLDVFSVPTVYREPKGLYVLEAWAAGVPVVQPRHGSFPELIDAAEGGLLVEPDDPAALANGLNHLLQDAEMRRRLGRQGQAAVRQQFHAANMAAETLRVFERYASSGAERRLKVS